MSELSPTALEMVLTNFYDALQVPMIEAIFVVSLLLRMVTIMVTVHTSRILVGLYFDIVWQHNMSKPSN